MEGSDGAGCVQRFSGKKLKKRWRRAANKVMAQEITTGYPVVGVAPGTITKPTCVFKMDGNGNGYSQPFPM